MSNRVEFVSYDGEYPCLCSGTLVLRVDGIIIEMPRYSMRTGGYVWFDDEWREHVDSGPWMLCKSDIPEFLKPLTEEIEAVINANIPYGCCGGCI